ncbi:MULTISPECIES: hypothetical protein [unclassified Streptomyces]|uniref:hypothetical protein n=1 Tax=unclassified Streptomyces TaxID=2593676 RepID=UPI0033306AB2
MTTVLSNIPLRPKDSSELAAGDIVRSHDMRVRLDTLTTRTDYNEPVYSWAGTVLNLDKVATDHTVPLSFLRTWKCEGGWTVDREDVWTIQGTKSAIWYVETPPVDVPTNPKGERVSARLLTVEGSSYGPYVGLPLHPKPWPYAGYLFTRATAEKIVRDANKDAEQGSGLTGEFADDGTLTFRWTEKHDGTGGRQDIIPDPWGRYEIGGMWAWEPWAMDHEQSDRQKLYGLGATEYRRADPTSQLTPLASAWYAAGRAEAHALTLRLEDTPGNLLADALAKYGITVHAGEDYGNTWLNILLDQAFSGSNAYLIAEVVADGEYGVFVDEPVGNRRAEWHVSRSPGNGIHETLLLTVSADQTDRVAAYIADLLVAP